MAVSFPALFFALFMLVVAGRSGWRLGFVYASIVYTLCVLASTELLSLFSWLKFGPVLAFWMAMTTVAAFLLWRYGDRAALRGQLCSALRCGSSAKVALAAVVAVLAVVFTIALVSPVNNWESMAYRMMRVAMWMDQHSVAHYPTGYIVQIYYPPLVSFQSMHLQILSHGDRFANMPEWTALVGCCVAASLTAKELSARFFVQVIAALVAVTLPMAILQGSSTAANLSAAYWLLCFVLLFVQHLQAPTRAKLACCGLALGFALCSKPTAYAIAPALALVLVLYGFMQGRSSAWRVRGKSRQTRNSASASRARTARRGRRRRQDGPANAAAWVRKAIGRVVLWMACVGTIALTVNLGHYGRNWQAFEHPLSPAEARNQINQTIDRETLTINLLWNAALHWGLPIPSVNLATIDAVTALGNLLGVSSDGLIEGLYQTGLPARPNEVDTPNLLHFWVLTISMLGLCAWRRRTHPLTLYLVGATALAIVTFNGMLEWSRYNASYHVPLFMLGAPLVAVFFSLAGRAGATGAESNREWPLWALSAILLLGSLPWLLFKESAPLLDIDLPATIDAEPVFSTERERAYFNHIGGRGWPTYEDFVDLIDFVVAQDPATVGLQENSEAGYGHWFQAYAIYTMLKDRLDDVAMEYFGVANSSAALRRDDHPPPALILLQLRVWDPRNLEMLGGLVAKRIYAHPSGLEAWEPVRPFGGTMRALEEIETAELPLACDQIRRQAGPSLAFLLADRPALAYLPGSSASELAVACDHEGWRSTAPPLSPAGPAQRIALHMGGSRFEFDVRDYRRPLGAFVFDVPAHATSISVAELDGEERVQWEVELPVPAVGQSPGADAQDAIRRTEGEA